MFIEAEWISSDLTAVLTEKAVQGSVHSIFREVLNIRLQDNRIVSVTASGIPHLPSAVKLGADAPDDFCHIRTDIGNGVTVSKGRVDFEDGSLCIGTKKAKAWDAGLQFVKPPVSKETLTANLERIKTLVLEQGNRDGLSSILHTYSSNRLVRFVMPSIDRLAKAIRLQNRDLVSEAAVGLLGFGPGLTPSADDFLLGIMASLYYIGDYYDFDLSRTAAIAGALVRDLGGRTTLVSETMLKNGALGYFNQPLRALMQVLTSKEAVKDECLSVIGIGGCSGSDCLAGVVFGARLTAGINEEKEAGECL